MYFFLKGRGQGNWNCLLVEAANGVTPAIQGLNICSGVITSKILGGGGVITPRILGGGYLPPGFTPLISATAWKQISCSVLKNHHKED